ncbi:hypothetical protein RsoP1IDN_32 [Ralstonia phage RsoP1IDN]|uniref:Internal virion protein n=1 Tax=Ralstonia phage RsoP1IDN TaxID=2060091 RepID=A0A2P0VPG7_9CAUD|nr:internal virion protein [Ralstonia phage RsoP1IDN]AUG85433.1 hypothetical protein RsoP1IDN_32 [Ralstonia phage RsoP1IDN]
MAETFGISAGGDVVVQSAPAAPQGPQVRLNGRAGMYSGQAQVSQPGGIYGAEAVAQDNAKTMDALNKLTQGALEPYIQQEKQKQYYEGMVMAAQGKSLVDIQKEQPWFTNIFGPSATVRGAQAMTAMGALDNAKTDFLGQMPVLRTQSPDAVRQMIVSQFSKLGSTGDPATDVMIQAKLAEQMPGLLDIHTREHVKYIQESNSSAFQKASLASGKSLQAVYDNGDSTMPQQIKDNEWRYAQESWAPMPGQDQRSWQQDVFNVSKASLMEGNFAHIEALKSSQFWGQLDPEAQSQIEKMIPVAREHAKRYSPSLTQDVFNVNTMEQQLAIGMGPQSIDDLHRWMDAKDGEWTKKTGTSQPYFDNAQRSALEDKWFAGMKAKHASSAAANAKVQDIALQEAMLRQGVNSMTTPPSMDKIGGEVKQAVMGELYGQIDWTNPSDPKQQTLMSKFAVASANLGPGMTVQAVQGRWRVAAQQILADGANVSQEAQGALQQWRAMLDPSVVNGRAALSQYLGAEEAAKVEALIAMSPDLADPNKLRDARKAIRDGYAAVPHTEQVTAAEAIVEKETPGILGRIFGSSGQLGGIKLNEGMRGKMVKDLAQSTARFMQIGLSPEAAAQQAFDMRYGGVNGADMFSGIIIEKRGAASTLAAKLVSRNGGSQGQSDYQEAVDLTWRTKVAESVNAQIGALAAQPGFKGDASAQFDPSKLEAVYGTNLVMPGGKTAIALTVSDKRGKTHVVTFTEDDVSKTFDALATKRATNSRKAVSAAPAQQQMIDTGFGVLQIP